MPYDTALVPSARLFSVIVLPRRRSSGARRSPPTAAAPTKVAAYRASDAKSRWRCTADAGDSLQDFRQEVGPSTAYTLCTFGILSRDRARLANVLLLSVESVMGPKSDSADCAPGRPVI